MFAFSRAASALAAALIVSACEPTTPSSKPPAKQLSQTLRQDIQAGGINAYEQYSRCAGLHGLFAKLGESSLRTMAPQQRQTFSALALRSAVFNALAVSELIFTDPKRPNIETTAKRQAQRNTEAYAGTYALVFFSAQVQSSNGKPIIPDIIESDIRTCDSLLADKIKTDGTS